MPHMRFSHGRVLIIAALFYLLLPCLLFSLEVLTVQAACFSILGLTSSFIICIHSLYQAEKHVYFFSRRDLFYYILTLILIVLLMECMGFNLHVRQHGDFVVRNPIYYMLINRELPLYSAQGEYFVYYHAFWLPPAYLSRVFPALNPDFLLYFWTLLGLFLSVSLLFLRLKGSVPVFCILVLISGMPLSRYVDIFLPRLPETISEIIKSTFDSFYSSSLFYTSTWSEITATFNHTIPLLVLLPLFLLKHLPFHLILFSAILIVPCTPLGSVVMAPLVLALYFHQRKYGAEFLLRNSLIIAFFCSPILACSIMYFSLAGGAGVALSWHMIPANTNRCAQLSLFGIGLLSQWLFVWIICFLFNGGNRRLNKHLRLLITIILLISSLIWIGRNDCNELMFKSGAVLFPLLAFYMFLNRSMRHISMLNRVIRCLILLTFPIWIIIDFKFRIIPSYTWDKDKMTANKRTDWGDTLDHPEHIWYGSFWAGKIPNPHIFKIREGTKIYISNSYEIKQ